MRGKVQWKVQLHGISRKNTISEEALREAVGALVNHASACHMDHMEAKRSRHLQLSQAKNLGKQPLVVQIAFVVTPLGGGVVCEYKQFCTIQFPTVHALFNGVHQVAKLPEVGRD